MKDNTFGKLMLGGSCVVAIIIMLASCVFVAWKPEQPAPCCEEEVCEEEEALPPLSPFDLISEE
jgi:hypothetical protein|tara:strand:- start:2265 stop:2456 length:192 start_codon:yes stop_codon:yes gene_type:complete